MSPSMQVWKRVSLSLQGLMPLAEPPSSRPKPRSMRLERLMARNLLAADPGPTALQYTAGATIPGQFAMPMGFNQGDSCAPYDLSPPLVELTSTPLPDNLGGDVSSAGPLDENLGESPLGYGPLAALQSSSAAGPSAYGITGGSTELDSQCAALEILIALLEGQLQTLLNQQATTNDPTVSAWLQGQINALSASILSVQSDLDNMNCSGGSSPGTNGGATSGASGGSVTEGSSGGYTYGSTYGYSSGSSGGMSGGSSAGISGGTTGGYYPSQPGASSGSGGYSATSGSYGATSGSAGSQLGTTWGTSGSGSGSSQGSGQTTGGATTGGSSGGYSGGATSGSYGGNTWTSAPGYSSGTSGFSSGNSSGGTEVGTYSLSNVRAGTFAFSSATEVGPVHEGQPMRVVGQISVPRPANGTQTSPPLIVQADLNFDGQFNDQDETIQVVVWHGMSAFDVVFTVRDDGPSPGNGTANDQINVRVSLAGQTATTTATVLNVAPWFVHPPVLTFETNAQGDPVAVVTAEFADPGLLDMHQLEINWGDGRTTTASTEPLLPAQQPGFIKTLRATRTISENDWHIRPLTLILRDDDTDEAAYLLTFAPGT